MPAETQPAPNTSQQIETAQLPRYMPRVKEPVTYPEIEAAHIEATVALRLAKGLGAPLMEDYVSLQQPDMTDSHTAANTASTANSRITEIHRGEKMAISVKTPQREASIHISKKGELETPVVRRVDPVTGEVKERKIKNPELAVAFARAVVQKAAANTKEQAIITARSGAATDTRQDFIDKYRSRRIFEVGQKAYQNPEAGWKDIINREANRLATLKFGPDPRAKHDKTPRKIYYKNQRKSRKARTAVEYRAKGDKLNLENLPEGEAVVITAEDPRTHIPRVFLYHDSLLEDITALEQRLRKNRDRMSDVAWPIPSMKPGSDDKIKPIKIPVTIGESLKVEDVELGLNVKNILRLGPERAVKELADDRKRAKGKDPLPKYADIVHRANALRREVLKNRATPPTPKTLRQKVSAFFSSKSIKSVAKKARRIVRKIV